MAHNPIRNQQTLSRTDLSFNVPMGTIGVLYQGQRFVRLLHPGERPSVDERLNFGGLLIYLVEVAPRTLTWRGSLPAKGDKDFFAITLNLKYEVSDPKRMVDERVTDTEVLLTRVLEPLLRPITRQFTFNQHSQADAALESEIQKAGLAERCGLRLIDPPDVVINLTDADHQRIKRLNELERAMRVALPAEHTDDLPSKEAAHKFHVTVNLSYQVVKPDELPSDSLEEAEKQLWPKLRAALRRTGRQYEITDITRADAEMQATLDDLVDAGLEGFGLKVTEASVSIDLDEAARKQYIELAQVKHNAALEAAKLDGLQRGMTFYTDLIQKGDWAVLAVAVSKGEISTEELYQRLNTQDRERLALQMQLLKDLRADNAKDESQDWTVAQDLLKSVAGTVIGKDKTQPTLAPGQTPAQLLANAPKKTADTDEAKSV